MATRYLTRSLFTSTRQSITSAVYRSYSTTAVLPNYSSSSFLSRLRPLVAAANSLRRGSSLFATRGLSTNPTNNSLSDPNPNWSNRPPKETILLDGCDFEHWLVVMEKPEGDPTRDEIIDSYIKTLAKIVGSEAEARQKIYSVSTRHYFAFGALVSEELSYKLKELPQVRWVLPDSYLDVRNKDYGGEPFINGEAVPYDPKYHEEWVRNNAHANERNRRNDRPRNFDRSRTFERRGPPQNAGGNYGGPPGGAMQPNTPPQQQNMHQQQPNMPPPPPNYGGGNMGNYPPPNNQYGNAPNYQAGPGPNQQYNQNMGYDGGQPQAGYAPNARPPPPGQNLNAYPPPNMGQGQGYAQNGGSTAYGNQNVPGRDMPHRPNY